MPLLLAIGLNESDVDGYDAGFYHSHTSEMRVLVAKVSNYISYLSSNEADSEVEELSPLLLSRAEVVTKWPLVAYLLTAGFCLGLSTTCHLCWVKNERVSNLVTYLDYWGIALLLLGSAYPYIAFKYACGPFIVWRYIFTSIISVLTLVACWASI